MLCTAPLVRGSLYMGCGLHPICLACRINRRRDWTARCLLEHAGHKGTSAFVTLTYSDKEVVRDGSGRGVLSERDVRWFVQRLRREVGGVRYVVVGEYGERTERPHFHALLWFVSCKDAAGACVRAWTKGYVHVGEISEDSIQYTISYLLKRMIKPDDVRLDGRPPEFGRFSHGLGASCLSELRRVARVTEEGTFELPREFRLNGKVWAVPKYVRAKLVAEGFTFARRLVERQEEAFVSAVRYSKGAVASAQAFRAEVSAEVESRRERSRVRVQRRLIGDRKYETL